MTLICAKEGGHHLLKATGCWRAITWTDADLLSIRPLGANLSEILIKLNTMRPRQNGRHFADDIFKCIFVNENVWIPIKISLKFVPKGPINNIPSLDQIMAWRRTGDKPLSEPMMVSLPTHICVTQPQWVKKHFHKGKCIWKCHLQDGGHFVSNSVY